MFTGIITHTATLKTINQSRYTFQASADFCQSLQSGSSVAINGTCLTIVEKPANDNFTVEMIPETLSKTMFQPIEPGTLVNLEKPATTNQLLDGHIVQGHIDGLGKIDSITPNHNSHEFKISLPNQLSRYLVNKGSIAMNGISLTIIEAHSDHFTVGIIPYTWQHTMLHTSQVGDSVNLEVDVLAKYIEKLLKPYQEVNTA
jgi:riboflavin synthase